MAKKHSLTIKTDKITGGKGKDLFVGALDDMGNATLTSADKLDGAGGVDTLRADLLGGSISASLKNIEIGNFTNSAGVAASMDLTKAKAMTKLVVTNPVESIDFTGGSAVASITLAGVEHQAVTVNGIDAKATKTVSVTFDQTKEAQLFLGTDGSKQIKALDITLQSSGAALGGNVDARAVAVHSLGETSNTLLLSPVGSSHSIEHLTITGTADLYLDQASSLLDLRTYDASKAKADIAALIGGDHLTSVLGSAGSDSLALLSCAGSAVGKTTVSLGKGDDSIGLNFAFNAKTQSYDGGKGNDVIHLLGAASNLASAVKNFEFVDVTNATGQYDVSGMKLLGFYVESTAGATSVTGLANNASVVIVNDVSNFLSVSLADQPVGAASMQLSLYNGSQLGTAAAGFSVAGVDDLEIHVFGGDATVFLGSVGTAGRMVALTVTGGDDLALSTANGANTFVSGITVEGDGGLDMTGFASSGLSSAGVTITGGAGDDVLVGGAGSDLIVSGAGNNMILGSAGADRVQLMLGSGADTLIFTDPAQSGFGIPGDTVENFGAFDTIDISDIVSNVTFVGNFADITSGNAALLTAHASAYYNTSTHVLYIDVDHNKQMNGGMDMQVTLEDLASFNSNQLIS